jgi:hypothetical protein
MSRPPASLEDRVRAIEDTLAIIGIIASHPPAADTGDAGYYRDAFLPDGIMDVGTKAARGNEAIGAIVTTPEHQDAIAGGLCHFAGLPRVVVNGDRAVAISYLQVLAPNRTAEPVALANHGISRGYRIHRLGANRWDFVRTAGGWKVAKRSYRMLDGNPEAPDMLREALSASGPTA